MNMVNLKKYLPVVVLLGVFIVAAFINWYGASNLATVTENTSSNVVTTFTQTLASAKTDNKSVTDSTNSTVNIKPLTAPVNGKKFGVVLFGASGFDAIVVTMDKKNNYVKDFYKPGISLAKEELASPEDVRQDLKNLIELLSVQAVDSRDIHFVVSSGALKQKNTVLIASALQSRGYVVNKVSAEEEGIYAYKAAMNPAYVNNSYVVDIGSSNTKVAWMEANKINTIELQGSKYFQNTLITDDVVFNQVKNAVSKIPSNLRENCFIIGGVPNTLAKQHFSGSVYTLMKPFDSYTAQDKKVSSGLNILKALQAGTGTQNFIFNDDANFVVGFLMTLNR